MASCVRTKDWGRYLPEWVAYHWALGVDEFVVLDDESVDDTREVRCADREYTAVAAAANDKNINKKKIWVTFFCLSII